MILNLNIILIFLFFVIVFLLSGCDSRYEEIGNQWFYVTYDERGERIRKLQVDKKTFQVINNEYAKDNLHVFYKGRVIENADSESFKVIKEGYSKDKNNVYLYWYPLINVNPNKFKILGGFFSKDDKNIYCGTVPLILEDISSFKIERLDRHIVMMSSKEFIKHNLDYSFINTEKYKTVVYCNSIGKSNTGRFEGVRKID